MEKMNGGSVGRRERKLQAISATERESLSSILTRIVFALPYTIPLKR